MRKIAAYLRAVMADPMYLRVSVATLGALIVALACAVAANVRPTGVIEWLSLVLIVGSFGLYGAYLLYASSLGSDATFEKATHYVDDGGELLGLIILVLVAIAAIPITIGLKFLRRHRN